METRKCSRCQERKPINEFYKKGFNKQGIQQYSSRCRQYQNEACPQLDPQYWPIGVAESIYKQFGMEWSYV